MGCMRSGACYHQRLGSQRAVTPPTSVIVKKKKKKNSDNLNKICRLPEGSQALLHNSLEVEFIKSRAASTREQHVFMLFSYRVISHRIW